ncbi:DUF3883 domain-containing protein [Colwellia piezophila]|uniref:DUF3883 domain-containing protein n=1 Tax=Colwellia piezophila TaxID=211668 RepID=UPI000380D264|nr:DUF3883 domain-containing protein [Colwellia piezophila]
MSVHDSTYKENLVTRITGLINSYTKDTILKEFLQNADDSGATELIVTYDQRNHLSLNGTEFEEGMGCALVIQNNSLFQEKDFDSIKELSAQGKSGESDKTGRFGQGFSSSFSISDHPSFISNGRAYWFDIQHTAVSKNIPQSIRGWGEEEYSSIKNWVNTFKSPNCNNLAPTTFRLPVRNEVTSKQSKISTEIFTIDDFYILCDEWKKNPDNLLFLRSIHRLVLKEISENGDVIVHVEITTSNSKEVENINKEIKKEFKNSPIDTCNYWLSSKHHLPFYTYYQELSVSSFNKVTDKITKTKEKWAVANGLFRGNENNLIHQAIKALNITPIPRKVLPWVGVAIKIGGDGKPCTIKGKTFTFLHLPIDSGHPVHIHGWFDLNDTRTELTFKGSGNDKEILIGWNQLLLKEGVGKAWVNLLSFIKNKNYIKEYYKLWLNPQNNMFDNSLKSGFYRHASINDCFYSLTKDTEGWMSSYKGALHIHEDPNDLLLNPLREHFNIVSPTPPRFVINNINRIDLGLTSITPKYIRGYISKETDGVEFPILFGKSSIEMLNNRTWFKEILNYCSEDGSDYSLLDGLPFELRLNNFLYRIDMEIILDQEPDLDLFQNHTELFLAKDVIDVIKDDAELPCSWEYPSLQTSLKSIENNFNMFKLDKLWIKNIVSFITNHSPVEINRSIDSIRKLKIFNTNRDELINLTQRDKPLIIDDRDIENIECFEATDIELIHPEYLNVYAPLVNHNVLDRINPENLVKHLITLKDYSFFKNKRVKNFLTNFIVSDIEWFETLDSKEKELFKLIPFIQTENDNSYCLNDEANLFLPSNFEPPKHIHSLNGEYELIRIVDTNHKELLKRFGKEEQSILNYIDDVIIPFIKNTSDVADRDRVLIWLASEWDHYTNNLNEEKLAELTKTLTVSKIIPNLENTSLNTAQEYYLPSHFEYLPTFLQNKLFLPMFFEEHQEKWNFFLKQIGCSQSILPSHIIYVANEIIINNNQLVSIKLLRYISDNYENFERVKYEGKALIKILSNKPWFPVAEPKILLKPQKEYTKLDYSRNLILGKDIKVAGGKFYALHFGVDLSSSSLDTEHKTDEKTKAKALGLCTSVPIKSVFESFEILTSIVPISITDEGEIKKSAKAFYSYIGRLKIENIPRSIKNKCIRIREKWLPSNIVFKSLFSISNTYCWNDILNGEQNENLQSGLEKLGVLNKPKSSFFIERLNSLPMGKELNKTQLRDAKELQKCLVSIVDRLAEGTTFPLLSKQGVLYNANVLYIDDFPAYHNADDKNDKINLCKKGYPNLEKFLGVKSLAETAKGEIDQNKTTFTDCISPKAKSIKSLLKSNHFKVAILRLNYHENKISESELDKTDINRIIPSDIYFSNKIVVDYYVRSSWLYTDNEATTFENHETDILYILNQDDLDDMCEIIAAYIQKKTNLSRESFSSIEKILRKNTEGINIAKLLDSRKVKELPEKIYVDIEDDVFDYEDNFEGNIDDYSLINETDFSNTSNSDGSEQSNLTPPELPHETAEKSVSTNSSQNSTSEVEVVGRNTIEGGTNNDLRKVYGNKPSFEKNEQVDRVVNSFSGTSKGNTLSLHKKNEGEGDSDSNRTVSNKPNRSNKSRKSKSAANIVSDNSKLPVTVFNNRYDDEHSENLSLKIGDKGEDFFKKHYKAYILKSGNNILKMGGNNEGYDFQEIDKNGRVVRYIEVKTLTGSWRDRGVSVTLPQVKFALENDNWWLVVIENINQHPVNVYQLKNPVLEMKRFMFDSSWKKIARDIS